MYIDLSGCKGTSHSVLFVKTDPSYLHWNEVSLIYCSSCCGSFSFCRRMESCVCGKWLREAENSFGRHDLLLRLTGPHYHSLWTEPWERSVTLLWGKLQEILNAWANVNASLYLRLKSRGGPVATQEKSQLRRIPESAGVGNCGAQSCHAQLKL